ncbi:S4 domain-containing protein YaaA [Lactobacillus sp. S2-2]|uniref:S4 domain-containing protein YaaA n=1 Tax=Lactobacillus sp. S2-2 TaxID=2692917 RepID=UPI001F31B3E3|nr:S4 domain-containing protein YaaA [Lactobacillus sp. S2-2]MCF6515392.1 S4 domain-containing protein YaaA [Lactobacillus sp. S2-2]
MKKEVLITTPYITLGQLLKEEDVISSGGQAKWYLKDNLVYLNDEPENRRGKKLYDGDTIRLADESLFFIKAKQG